MMSWQQNRADDRVIKYSIIMGAVMAQVNCWREEVVSVSTVVVPPLNSKEEFEFHSYKFTIQNIR
jgi:hypothetical protein